MLLIGAVGNDTYIARFVAPCSFILCLGARDPLEAANLAAAFARGDFRSVKSLQRNDQPDESCWCVGKGWWLSANAAVTRHH